MANEATGLEVAVIGIAGRFPGAVDVSEFWDIVRTGRETISRFPDAEAGAAGVPGERPRAPGHVAAGGVLTGADRFDHRLFGYSPRDAALLDPQQRLFLECAWTALEDAGYRAERFPGLVGVYASTSQSSYLQHFLRGDPRLLSGVGAHELMLANDKDTLATRVAYHLDLRGPALTVQSSCSSSLVGVHLACQALLSRECDLALAGGVTVQVPQREGYQAGDGGVMSPTGHCYPFDSRADGTVSGDGVAIVVLKPLSDALRDRDTVHAVIKGSAVNNDGAGKVGFSAPGAAGQSAVMRMAHQVADVPAGTISYVETHGTGTALGDPIEFAALRQVFEAASAARGSCALGSLKSAVGHLDAAAGVSGLIKTVLALKHGVIPPSPYFRRSNPEIDLEASPFRIPVEPAPWPAGPHPRRAAVSAFGMGGTNAHAVLEEAPAPRPGGPAARPRQLLVLSAASPEALDEGAARLAAYLDDAPAAPLADVAYTLHVGRRLMEHRLAVVCDSHQDAADRLRRRGPSVLGGASAARGRPVALLFPGQGAQHPGMAGQLYGTEPVFRHWFDTCADLLSKDLDTDLRAVVHGGSAALLNRTEYTQPALFATEYALARLWLAWGVRPAAMLGHSVGEYVAACLAGTFELPDALTLVAARGRLMQALPGGDMVSVRLAPADLEEILPPGVSLAAANAERLSVASGPAGPVAELLAILRRRGVGHTPLHTSHAFHSAMMDPIVDDFARLVDGVARRAPGVPFVSGTTGRWITAEQARSAGYWARHLREPVRFQDGLRQLLDAADGEPRILLEAGPGTTLTSLARQHDLGARGHTAVASLGHPSRPEPDSTALHTALGTLAVGGADVDWNGYWAGEARGRVPLPTYAFARTRHWLGTPAVETSPVETSVAETPAVDTPAPGTEAPEGTAAEATAKRTAEGTAADGGARTAAVPETVPETVLAVWRDLLGIARIRDDDDFFSLGGHSLLATQVTARVHEALGVEIPAAALFEAPTLGGFTELVRQGVEAEIPAGLLEEMAGLPADELRALLAEDLHG